MNEVAQVGAGTINLFYPSLIFEGMAAPCEEPLGQVPTLLTNIVLGWKMPESDKYNSLL